MARTVKLSAELLDTTTKQVLEAIISDNIALRAALVAVTAKLDLDAGVTDVNYASLCNPPALKGTL